MVPEDSKPRFCDDATSGERVRWLNGLANLPLFTRAADDSVERFVKAAEFRRYAPLDLIFDELEPASHVHILICGTARVFQSSPESGAQYTPKVFQAPTHFGDLGALAGLHQNRSSVQALTECVTAAIPMMVVEEQLAADHGLCLAWLYSVARQHAVTIDSARQNVFGGASARLANVLLSYAEAFGVQEKELTAIDFPLSYNTLARQVGVTRRNAIALMQRFQGRGVVTRSSDGWLVNTELLRLYLTPGNLSIAHSFADVSELFLGT